jgi:hypothetical protein
MSDLKLDKTSFSISSLNSNSDKLYWLSQTPEKRLIAMQINRQAAYGESAATGRLQRILEVVERRKN